VLESTFDNWQYSDTGNVKHLFYSTSNTVSICGTGIYWPNPETWKNDEEGLRKKRPCKRCIRIRDS
jgi:hypothetical protein